MKIFSSFYHHRRLYLSAGFGSGASDANIQFEELCNLLENMGFEKRIRGSHHIFRKEGIMEKINLQREGNKAKPYQVRQVRNIIVKYKFGGDIDV